MNAPLAKEISGAIDGRPELRATLAEFLGTASLYLQIAQDYLSLGDDGGAAYAMTQATTYFKAGISLQNRIVAANQKSVGAKFMKALVDDIGAVLLPPSEREESRRHLSDCAPSWPKPGAYRVDTAGG